MKNTTFKCEITDQALDAYDEHIKHNPNGVPVFSGKPRRKPYYGYVIYETAKTIFIEELKGR